ncbi:MAG TPA: hypothetical protein VF538_15450 [Pyrinomonadaceae bacterium]|jgi:hypothetical protein
MAVAGFGKIFARRRLGLAAACALGLVALAPQLHLWRERGRDWGGACATIHPDETAYLAYVNALIDGRGRRADPYTGRDEELEAARVESIFSVQFLPAYAVALPARLFGLTAHAAFIALSFLAAFAAALTLYHLLFALLADEWAAAAGALSALAFGAVARGQKLVTLLTGHFTPFFPTPFLRRYLPAAPFFLLFLFCLCVWRALTVGHGRNALLWSAGAGASFAAMVFSYFYLWTAALAWLACLAPLWLLSRRGERRRALTVFGVVALCAACALAPYALLLSRRAPSTDMAQLLVRTRAPDLFRLPELVGLLVVAALVAAARRGVVEARDRVSLFACSLGLAPLVAFNQQVLTGLSLQPIHYEQFVANYVAPLSAFVAAALLWRAGGGRLPRTPPYPRRALAALAAFALCWALFESLVITRRLARLNVTVDSWQATARALREAARRAPGAEAHRSLVFCPESVGLCDLLPGSAPQAILWGWHMPSFPGVSQAENKERLRLQLYYSGVGAPEFARLAHAPGPYRTAIFGWGRATEGLAAAQTPISEGEERAEVETYARFVADFDRARAAAAPLTYVVVMAEREAKLANLDRWYERDAGERAGPFTLYRVRLRP